MLKELIKIANSLDDAGLTKEASELDEVIKVIAQDTRWSVEDMNVDGTIESLKRSLYKQVDEKVAVLKALADSKPEDFRGSKESWMWSQLEKNPIVIKIPRD